VLAAINDKFLALERCTLNMRKSMLRQGKIAEKVFQFAIESTRGGDKNMSVRYSDLCHKVKNHTEHAKALVSEARSLFREVNMLKRRLKCMVGKKSMKKYVLA
jgi:hypothetical protein